MSPIADMIARIKNAVARKKKEVSVPHSRIKQSVLDALVRAGYIKDYVINDVDAVKKNMTIGLKYYDQGRSVISSLVPVSKPSRHVYTSLCTLRQRTPYMGVQVVSTSAGVLLSDEAVVEGVGGKVLLEVK